MLSLKLRGDFTPYGIYVMSKCAHWKYVEILLPIGYVMSKCSPKCPWISKDIIAHNLLISGQYLVWIHFMDDKLKDGSENIKISNYQGQKLLRNCSETAFQSRKMSINYARSSKSDKKMIARCRKSRPYMLFGHLRATRDPNRGPWLDGWKNPSK